MHGSPSFSVAANASTHEWLYLGGSCEFLKAAVFKILGNTLLYLAFVFQSR
jgi:hypothetical protein